MVEGAATALGSVAILGLAGFLYHQYYKSLTLRKMDQAFVKGYSSFELAALFRHASSGSLVDNPEDIAEDDAWIPRPEQAVMDRIIDGTEQGHYYLIYGEKGTGKTSMLLKSMKRIDGDGVAMLEANGDVEIFRLRLGKALNYEFHEDYIGSLFSFKGPRDSTSLLDIERAFNKLEKIALKRRETTSRPLLLVINRAHVLNSGDEGKRLLDMIQQRAELWAASRLVTVVLFSDEYWIQEHMWPHETRLRVMPVHDIPKDAAISAMRDFRKAVFKEEASLEQLERVYGKIGGRLSFLNQAAKAPDMDKAVDFILKREKQWFLTQCWILGKEMDDNAEDHQDYCAAAMLVIKALVAKEDEMKKNGEVPSTHGSMLPSIPLHVARQIMTRPDFITHHDHVNIFSIDSNSMVQADSVAMHNVFREILAMPGFEEHLQETLDRLDELEGLGRTREIVLKDLRTEGDYVKVETGTGSAGNGSLRISIGHAPEGKDDE